MGVIPFVWFLLVGFAVRYPFPEIRHEVPEKFPKRLNFDLPSVAGGGLRR